MPVNLAIQLESWPITFSVYKYDPDNAQVPNSFELSLQESTLNKNNKITIKSLNINNCMTKLMTNVKTENTLNKWVKEPLAYYTDASRLERCSSIGVGYEV